MVISKRERITTTNRSKDKSSIFLARGKNLIRSLYRNLPCCVRGSGSVAEYETAAVRDLLYILFGIRKGSARSNAAGRIDIVGSFLRGQRRSIPYRNLGLGIRDV